MMKPEFQKIFDLAQCDIRIHELKGECHSLETVRSELTARRAAKESELVAKRGLVCELQKKQIDAEGEVQFLTARVKEFEGKMNQIKTNKEYQAALKEVAEMKKGIREKEEVILQVMTEMEGAKKELETLEGEGKAQGEEHEKQHREMDEKEKSLGRQVEALQQKREEILPLVDGTLLAHYERIRKLRTDGIALVDQGNCQGCFRKIPPQLLNEIRKGLAVHSCPSCSRLLYLDEPEKGKEVVGV